MGFVPRAQGLQSCRRRAGQVSPGTPSCLATTTWKIRAWDSTYRPMPQDVLLGSAVRWVVYEL